METRLSFEMRMQPDETTCGPTCLHAVYNYYGEDMRLTQVINEVPHFDEGGTLAVFLAGHALKRGYQATIYTYNLHVFDPTWFQLSSNQLREKLRLQIQYKNNNPKLRVATKGYLEFLELGGRLRFKDLTSRLIQSYLRRSIPILTGLSATYLYQSPREYGTSLEYDDIRGEPSGHFVVLSGYDPITRHVLVADPLYPNPLMKKTYYEIEIDRVIAAILLGILTHDANFLILEPGSEKRKENVNAYRREQSQTLVLEHS